MNAPRPIEPDALTARSDAAPWRVIETADTAPTVDAAARRIAAPYGSDPAAQEARRVAVVAAALAAVNPDRFAAEIAEHARPVAGPAADEAAAAALGIWPRLFAANTGLADPRHLEAAPGTVDRITRAAENGRPDIAVMAWANALGTADQRAASIALGRAMPDRRAKIADARDAIYRRAAEITRAAARRPADHDRYTDTGASRATTWATWDIARIIGALVRDMTPATEPAPNGRAEPIELEEMDTTLWEPVTLWTPTHTVAHSGMLARSTRRRTDRGRTIASPQRLYTDPMRRAFTRRTRDNGGTVVIDASGSMSLEPADITRILDAAPGARIFAYRHSHAADANLYLLAEHGRRIDTDTDGMPVTPGGSNGIDGPALRYAAARHEPGQPFIWITDGGYNGRNGGNNRAAMAADILAACAAVVVHSFPDIDTAEIELDRLARGGQLSPPTWPDTVAVFQTGSARP